MPAFSARSATRLFLTVFVFTAAASGGSAAAASQPAEDLQHCPDGWLAAHTGGGPADSPCPGVRPGGLVRIPSADAVCTLNFLFTGYRVDENGESVPVDRFIGTAGHCALEFNDRVSWPPGEGPVAFDAQGKRIGEVAWASTPESDFALIRLDPGVQADPQMCAWGGPTGINQDLTAQPTVLRFFGQGLLLSDADPAASAVALTMHYPDEVMAYGPENQRTRVGGTDLFSDSGAGVISDDGRAVGILWAGGAGVKGPDAQGRVESGTMYITRIGHAIALVEEAFPGLDLRLETAQRI